MDDPQPPSDSERPPYLRLPWPLVGAGLLAVLLIALAAGVTANRYLRAQIQVVPTAPPAIASATATAVTLQVTLASTSGPTVPPTPVATPRPEPTLTPAVTAKQPTAIPNPTPDAELVAEISDAYQHYWEVRAEALYELNTSQLSTVMAGDHLLAIKKLISELRVEGRSIQTRVDHMFSVIRGVDDLVVVSDTYQDDSIYVDLHTHEVIGQTNGGILREQYSMEKVEGEWRVVSLVRAP